NRCQCRRRYDSQSRQVRRSLQQLVAKSRNESEILGKSHAGTCGSDFNAGRCVRREIEVFFAWVSVGSSWEVRLACRVLLARSVAAGVCDRELELLRTLTARRGLNLSRSFSWHRPYGR